MGTRSPSDLDPNYLDDAAALNKINNVIGKVLSGSSGQASVSTSSKNNWITWSSISQNTAFPISASPNGGATTTLFSSNNDSILYNVQTDKICVSGSIFDPSYYSKGIRSKNLNTSVTYDITTVTYHYFTAANDLDTAANSSVATPITASTSPCGYRVMHVDVVYSVDKNGDVDNGYVEVYVNSSSYNTALLPLFMNNLTYSIVKQQQADVDLFATVGTPGYRLNDPILVGILDESSKKIGAYEPMYYIGVKDDYGNCINSSKYTNVNSILRFGQRLALSCTLPYNTSCDKLAISNIFTATTLLARYGIANNSKLNDWIKMPASLPTNSDCKKAVYHYPILTIYFQKTGIVGDEKFVIVDVQVTTRLK